MSALGSRRLLPVEAWPAIDRRLWNAARGGDYFVTLSPGTARLTAEGYGRWIAVLASQGRLDERTGPADRVTPDSARAYAEALRVAGNNAETIRVRFVQLAAALRIMVPGHSFTWLHASKQFRDRTPASASQDEEHQLRGWPAEDCRLWHAGTQVDDILAAPRYAAGLRPDTILNTVIGYRRWLRFLRAQGRLDPGAAPAGRVTRENVAAYVRVLRDGHCNASLIESLYELRRAMAVMHPEADFRWLTSPGGRSLSSLLPRSPKPIQVFDSKCLYDWGLTMMQDALTEPHPEKRRMAYRDGLLIALFAARAPRLRSMASLRLGRTVIPDGKAYKLVFEKEDVKTSRPIEYHAPAGLSSAIERYVAVGRAELMSGQSHDWFWVDKYGEPWSAQNISAMIRRRSERAFGRAFGPHRFRHGIGTTAPLADPAHPGVAAAILGISGQVVDKHYNLANQADVANRFHATFAEERARLESLARREFCRKE